MDLKWTLTDNTLSLIVPKITVFWDMPDNYKMPNISLLSLVTWLLFSPFEEMPEPGGKKILNRTNIGVMYSGGIDSTVILELLPNTIPVHNIVANPVKGHKTENAIMATKQYNNSVMIRTNANEIPLLYGKRTGYHRIGSIAHTAVLLSEHLNIGTIATGITIEGIIDRFSDALLIKKIFNRFGLDLCLPLSGMTEVSIVNIYKKLKTVNPYAMTCLYGEKGIACDKCYKCYRKKSLLGEVIKRNKSIDKAIEQKYFLCLASYMWSVKYKKLKHPVLDKWYKIFKDNMEWIDKWNPICDLFIPGNLKIDFKEKLLSFGINTLKDNDGSFNIWVQKRKIYNI